MEAIEGLKLKSSHSKPLKCYCPPKTDIFAFVSPVRPPTWLMADSAEYENKKHCVRWRGRPYFAPRGFAHARERVLLMKSA